jgi:hypothetical protein
MKKIKLSQSFSIAALFFLSSCAVNPPAPSFSIENAQVFGEQPELPSENQIHQLAPDQEQAFLSYFDSPLRADEPTHRRLTDYLLSKVSGFTYSENTFKAEETLRLGHGNCVSLANVATAFANLAGVEADYQSIGAAPTYQPDVKSLSVRSILVGRPATCN